MRLLKLELDTVWQTEDSKEDEGGRLECQRCGVHYLCKTELLELSTTAAIT